ncbi:MAG TPA: ABC transporter permease [Methylomirabilota bacterium]|nr:ABC transporter permease [Methylomirabilota bacterium]
MRRRRLRFLAPGAALVGLAVACAALAPWLAPHDPYRQAVSARLAPPIWDGGSWSHPLGTDPLGRDILSRIVYGARVSISAGALAVLLSMTLGVLMGLLAGYFRGAVDTLISNVVNVLLAFPFLLLALAAAAAVGPGFGNMVVVLGVTGWPLYTRVVRAETLKYRERDFVQAARALGVGSARVLRAHILPNLVSTIIVMASLEVARMIILESFLSFLGIGIQPPTPSWGAMLGEGRVYMLTHWWLAAFPGAAIFVTTLGINLFGDGLRDLLDPHRVLSQPRAAVE